MLSDESYVKYLESVIISLLAEREEFKDIPIIDETSIMFGYDCSPINLREEIKNHRDKRQLIKTEI